MDTTEHLKKLQQKFNCDLGWEIWQAAYNVLKNRYPRFDEFEPNDVFCPYDLADEIIDWAEEQQRWLDEEEE